MPTPPVWTLNANGIHPRQSAGQMLVGCHITENEAGTCYEFTAPNITNVLVSTPGTSLPTESFTFPVFLYQGLDWTIGVTAPLTPGHHVTGTWSEPGDELSETTPQSGDYTAQSGSGMDEEEAASSAYA